jgi:hypothetical protein
VHNCSEIILIFGQLSVSILTKVILSLVFKMSEKFGFVWELVIVELVCSIGEGFVLFGTLGLGGFRGFLLRGCLGGFHILLLFESFRFLSAFFSLPFGVYIEERFSNIQIVSFFHMEFGNNSSIGALDFHSHLICFDIGNSFILIDPFTLFCIKEQKLLSNWATVPSLMESAKNGRLTVLIE